MKNRLLKGICGFFVLSLSLGLSFIDKKDKRVEAATYTQTVEQYYSSINWDQTGATLKTSLFNKIKITTAGWSYDGLWEAYREADVRPDGEHFWDIYSDTTMYTLHDSRINHSYKKEGDSINREHVIPQSTFNEAAPMKSDIHHVLPSDGYVNNRRSAYPHGIVTGSPTYTSNDGCKLGSGTGSTTVFEPMDNYKGDIARIYFYFVTCYQDKMSSNSFSVFDKSAHPSIKKAYLDVYLQWAKEDPVSEKEIKRNNVAYGGQGNRNPFIDCPYAVGAIWDPDHATDYGVKGEYTSGDGLTISKSTANLISGNSTTISATATGGSNISWTTSNSSVVSLSSSSSSSGSNITLTAGNAGTATVTATATISAKQYSKSCTVTVAATKQVSSIEVSNPKTGYAVDDEFVKPTVTATYNDDTEATVTNDCSFTGYDMSKEGGYTVTVSYSYGGANVSTTYAITVSSSGGSEDIDDYTISTTPLTSSGISNGMKVVWGTTTSNLATGIDSNWVRLSSNKDEWIMFTVEGTSSGFKLKHDTDYVYCSSAKNVAFSSTNYTTFTLRADNLVTSSSAGTFYYNGSGLRPYSSGSYTNAYLYALLQDKTLTEIDVSTFPTKTSYVIGENFNPAGLVISRTYSDSSSDTYSYSGHESEFTFDPSLVTPLTSEDDTIEVIYGGQSCFFNIDISTNLVLSSISVSGQTTNYVKNGAFGFDGVCTAHYEGGYEETVTPTSVSSPDMSTTGVKTITVSFTYDEVTKSTTYDITVTQHRVVIEETTVEATGSFEYSSGELVKDPESLAKPTTGGYAQIESVSPSYALRLGASKSTGRITVSATDITSITVRARAYGTDSNVILNIGGTEKTLTSSWADYTVDFATPQTSVLVTTSANGKRAYVSSLTITYSETTSEDIGDTADCVGLESFINDYMHMDYVENLGYCKDTEHHYYSSAKSAFNSLNTHQRALFTGNEAYASEWARLEAWANANGDELNESNLLELSPDYIDYGDNNSVAVIIIIVTSFILTALSSTIILKKKRRK